MPNETAYRVVVIDDDPDIAEEVCETLELAKFASVYAQSAEHACEILASGSDIGPIVVDYHMPGANGIELMQLLRSKTQRPLAFIMLTGDETQAVAAGAVRAQAFDFLSKPVNREELLSAVQRAAEHLDGLSKSEASQRQLQNETEALKQRVDAVSEILRQREKLLEGVLAPHVPTLERLKRSHAGATIDFLDQLAQIEDAKARRSRLGNDHEDDLAAVTDGAAANSRRRLDALECAPIDMSNLLKRLVPAIKKLADQNSVALKAVIPGHLPLLYGDQHRLVRAIQDVLVSFVRELGAGDRLSVILMKQEAELIMTLRLHSGHLAERFFDIFRGELPSVIDGLAQLPAPQARLLASRIVIQLHAGHMTLQKPTHSEWCLRIVLPIAAEADRRSRATA